MRKLLAAGSIAMSLAFALALANADADDQSAGTASDTSVSTDTQQSGTAMDNPSMEEGGTSASTTTTKKETAKSMKTCTDSAGKTFRKGEPGFKDCMKEMKNKEMGGMTHEDHSTDMSSQSGTMESDSSQSGTTGSDTGSTDMSSSQ